VTGGLLARAVEPAAGEAGRDDRTHERNCLNCGTPLTGPYCSECGQKAHVHRSVRAFFQDFVTALFNFEGKIWRTLPMLAWRPGEMTRRYIAGERARFISPVALYLFTVFAMFAVLNLTGALGTDVSRDFREGLKTEIADDQAKLASLEADRKAAAEAGKELAELDRKIANRKEDIASNERLLSGRPLVKADPGDETPGWLLPFIENAAQNPEVVSMKVQDAASKYSWLLIPFSVPFMWLLFPFRRRFNTYDHTVFVTYSLSFMMMLVVAGGLLIAAGLPGVASLLFFVPPFHMYRHLKQTYELGRFSAIMRTMALLTFAFIAAALFLAAAVAIGAM
ncbi:DUF3667 domain-containing protein, partial [Sphingomonas segetis]|uniref:DUF3667 domain-containing protein n=1 Tax=Sphingomonas segetis TaxID=1104779 RepID=UPI0030B82392